MNDCDEQKWSESFLQQATAPSDGEVKRHYSFLPVNYFEVNIVFTLRRFGIQFERQLFLQRRRRTVGGTLTRWRANKQEMQRETKSLLPPAHCVCVCVWGLYNCVFASSGRQSGSNVFPSKAGAYCLPGSRYSARHKRRREEKRMETDLIRSPRTSSLHLSSLLPPSFYFSNSTLRLLFTDGFHIPTKDDPLNEMSRRCRLI